VLTKKSVQSIINEQKLLSKLNSPFIVNMHYAFQDRETLYLVLDLMEGGDLRHHLSTKNFNEIQASNYK
jgi:serine/threonine protein kinase